MKDIFLARNAGLDLVVIRTTAYPRVGTSIAVMARSRKILFQASCL